MHSSPQKLASRNQSEFIPIISLVAGCKPAARLAHRAIPSKFRLRPIEFGNALGNAVVGANGNAGQQTGVLAQAEREADGPVATAYPVNLETVQGVALPTDTPQNQMNPYSLSNNTLKFNWDSSGGNGLDVPNAALDGFNSGGTAAFKIDIPQPSRDANGRLILLADAGQYASTMSDVNYVSGDDSTGPVSYSDEEAAQDLARENARFSRGIKWDLSPIIPTDYYTRSAIFATEPTADPNLAAVQAMTPQQVYKLRQAGEPIVIGGRSLRSTDVIAAAVGYTSGDMGRLPPAQIAENLDAVQSYVNAANARYTNLQPDLLNAVILYESRGLPNAVSATGALGIMQITSQNYLSGNYNPFVPEKAIDAGARMLSQYIDRYGTDQNGVNKTVAAYNQGVAAVDAALNIAAKQGTADWAKFLAPEGQRYITNIQLIRDGVYFRRPIPGYFGASR